MNLTLFHCPLACSRVTMNALEEAGLTYGDRLVNILKGEQKSPEYLAIHPGGKVPALQVDDVVITENASILLFLNDLAPEAALLPEVATAVGRAQQVSDLVWCSGTVHPAVRQVRMPIRFTDGDPSGVQEKGREYVAAIASQVEARTADDQWWYGADWSIVDVYLCWLFTTAQLAGFGLDAYPNVASLLARVQARPSYQRALAREAEAAKEAGIELPAPKR